MAISTAHILIRGHVQGIGFRRFVCDVAEETGVSGTVQNQSDGDVYAVAVGDHESVEKFIARVSLGNGFSIIEKVTVKWLEKGTPSGEFNIITTHFW